MGDLPRLRITILNEFFYPDLMGGTPKVLSDVANRLVQNHGADVTVITSRHSYRESSGPYSEREEWNGIQIQRVNSPNWSRKHPALRMLGNMLFARAASSRLSRIRRPDVVLSSTAPAPLPSAALAFQRRSKAPYAYIVYDLDPDRAEVLGVVGKDSAPARWLRRGQQRWLRGADRVVAIGRCMRGYLHERYGLPMEQIRVVEVGADPDTVRPRSKESAYRKKNGIEGFVVLYTGNFGKYHDFDAVLDCAKTLAQAGEDVTFVLVGDGAKRRHLASRIESEAIENVRLLPFVPDSEYADLLASGDLCLVTLEPGMEGLCVPSKFYSILAAGRPTLAVMGPSCEVARVIEEADCGWRVDIGDTDALRHAILAAKAVPEKLHEQGANARRVFDERYTTDHVAAKLFDVLSDVAARAR